MAEAVKAGKTLRRVRVVTRPLSFYTKWEFVWGYDWNVKAGEDIRILDVTDGLVPSCPTMTSGSLTMRPSSSSSTGRTAPKIGRELVEHPDLGQYLAWRDAAWERAVPFTDYHQGLTHFRSRTRRTRRS